jgi:DNA-nicking Smr family endonuclease
MKRTRVPTGEELELWETVAATVEPLTRPPVAARKRPAKGPEKAKPPSRTKLQPAQGPSKPRPPTPPPRPALDPIDRRTRSRLARGHVAIDARIDLHGMTQAAAEKRLRQFLADAQAGGARLVLVITGKGKAGTSHGEIERGVLRRVVPVWLSAGSMRSIVVGFNEAGPAHGGAGALYVRVRRRKG